MALWTLLLSTPSLESEQTPSSASGAEAPSTGPRPGGPAPMNLRTFHMPKLVLRRPEDSEHREAGAVDMKGPAKNNLSRATQAGEVLWSISHNGGWSNTGEPVSTYLLARQLDGLSEGVGTGQQSTPSASTEFTGRPPVGFQDMEKEREHLQAWKERVGQELDRAVAFWTAHSHDQEYGGFFTCLGRDGQVYDDLKYVWLQGRQVWMYCRLYRQLERFRRPELLDSAKAGGEFLLRYARVAPPGKKCAFVLTRDGRPVKVQRTIFSECFFTMAMNELWRVTGEARYQREAVEMMDQIVHWVREDPSGLGQPQLPGTPTSEPMAVPMMLLNLVDELGEADEVLAGTYAELGDWCAQRLLRHVQRDGQAVLENVSEDGRELSGCLGRHQNPGHAIEAGWFLLRYALRKGDPELRAHVIEKFLLLPFRSGWDPEHGGLFYFQDADGLCPTQLEWAMKLWWPHSEAMVAFLMGYRDSGDPALLRLFYQVAEYTFRQFRDPEHGEWFGYLSQEGKVALSIKGGPFKGCFHVPRCLAMCEEMLDALLGRRAPAPRAPPGAPGPL